MEKKQGGGGEGKEGGEGKGRKGWVRRPSQKERKKALKRTDNDAKPVEGGGGGFGMGKGGRRDGGGGELVLSKGRGGFGGEEVEKELGKNLEVLRLQDSIEESEEEKVQQ